MDWIWCSKESRSDVCAWCPTNRSAQVVEKTIPSVTNAIEKAIPVAQQATKTAVDVSSTAVDVATPFLQVLPLAFANCSETSV